MLTTGRSFGLFLIPALFSLLQCWAAHRVILRIPPYMPTDGILYVGQSWTFLHRWPHEWARYLLKFGLYPAFLSRFEIPNFQDLLKASVDPVVVSVYSAQALLLAAATAVFLW